MKIRDHLKGLPDSPGNQYFASGKCMMVQNYAETKDSFKVQDTPMDCSVAE